MEKAFYTKLNEAAVRVYALRAPQNATAPFVVYQRISRENWRSINEPSGIAQALMQVDTYATTYFEAKTLAASIETILDGFRGIVYYGNDSPQDMVRIAGISLQGDTDILDQTDEPFLYRVSASYLVTYYY